MPVRSASLKTLIGLPVVLIAAFGVALGASTLSRTLQQDPNVNVDAANTNTLTEQTNTGTTDAYAQALSELSSLHNPRAIAAASLTNTATNPTATANTARLTLEAVCWLDATPSDIQYFPAGIVQQDFLTMVDRYANPIDQHRACDAVASTAAVAAGKLLTLDEDGDTLNLIAEYWYGTNALAADTDNDGFSDTEEINNNFSPVGS